MNLNRRTALMGILAGPLLNRQLDFPSVMAASTTEDLPQIISGVRTKIVGIISGVPEKLVSAAKKGAAAGTEQQVEWERRVLGDQNLHLDDKDASAILDRADQDVTNELARLTNSARAIGTKANKPEDISKVKQEISGLQKWAKTDQLLPNLDQNPFKPQNFRKKIDTTLSAVDKAVH